MKVSIEFGGPRLKKLFETQVGQQSSKYRVSKETGLGNHAVSNLWAGTIGDSTRKVEGQVRLSTVALFLKYCLEKDLHISLSDMFTVTVIDDDDNAS